MIVTCESRMTVTSVACDGVSAHSAVPTGAAEAIIYVGLTPGTRESDGACTFETVDQVVAYTAVHAGVHLTLVNVHLALGPSET